MWKKDIKYFKIKYDIGRYYDDNSNQFLDALKEMQGVEVGNIVNVEVLSVEDGQIAVGVENAGVEGVITKREFTNDRNARFEPIGKTW
ncbi:30S ribosomal protein S1 [Lactobacillus gasseri]|nr:30S ribosomal protein S1 [Lactobacillus gasseri]